MNHDILRNPESAGLENSATAHLYAGHSGNGRPEQKLHPSQIKLPNTKIKLLQQLLKVDLIILLAENGYPLVARDEVYKEIFEQAENFKIYQSA